MGSKSDGGRSAAIAQSAALSRQASKQFEGLEDYLPTKEELEFGELSAPELILPSEEEFIRKVALEEEFAGLDPRLRESQMEAMGELDQLSREGLSPEDRAAFEQLQEMTGAQARAREKSILAEMASRGALDSGAQLSAQLSSGQQAAQQQGQASRDLLAQSAAGRRSALSDKANLAGQIRSADVGQAKDLGSAKQRIAEFNVGTSARGTDARQQQARDIANNANMREQQRIAAAQQAYQNRFGISQAKAGALSGQAQQQLQSAGMMQGSPSGLSKALGGAASGAGIGAKFGPMGAGIGAGAGALAGMFSADGGIKYADGGIGSTGTDSMSPEDYIALQEAEENKQAQENLAAMESGVVGSGQVSQDSFDKERQEVPSKTAENIGAVAGGLGQLFGAGQQQQAAPSMSLSKPNIMTDAPGSFQPVQIDQFADGGMNYQAGGEGTIIDSGTENFAGDELEDRINDGEMVQNLDQQDHINDLLQELAEYRRGDESVDNGEADVNHEQQEALMEVAKGEREPEELPNNDIVESKGIKKLIRLLGME